ncbi:MAG: hypothetical protein IJY70_03240 [Clostridia bacterium]|nr:hypothetical protein [Clostridia bacterium]
MFSSKIITLSAGRVSSARVEESGDTSFIIYSDGTLIEKKIPASSKQISFSSATTVSYADDCYKLDNGYLHRRGEYTYESR